MPRISRARASASSALAASLMPPAFPRPPVSTCALTTTGKPSSSAAARAPAGSVARRPSDTGIPCCRKSSFPWYSWRSKARASLPPRPPRVGARVCEHPRGVSRSTIIVLLALGATFAGFVLASNAQRLRGDDPDVDAERRRRPAVRDARLEGVVRSPWRRGRLHGRLARGHGVGLERAQSASRTARRSAGSSHRARPPKARSACSCSRRATRTSSTSAISAGTLPAVRAATGYEPGAAPHPRARSVVGRDDLRARSARRRELGARRVRHAHRRRQAAGGARARRSSGSPTTPTNCAP